MILLPPIDRPLFDLWSPELQWLNYKPARAVLYAARRSASVTAGPHMQMARVENEQGRNKDDNEKLRRESVSDKA